MASTAVWSAARPRRRVHAGRALDGADRVQRVGEQVEPLGDGEPGLHESHRLVGAEGGRDGAAETAVGQHRAAVAHRGRRRRRRVGDRCDVGRSGVAPPYADAELLAPDADDVECHRHEVTTGRRGPSGARPARQQVFTLKTC